MGTAVAFTAVNAAGGQTTNTEVPGRRPGNHGWSTMPPRIHAIVQEKGGVGKTTLTVNLAAVTFEALTVPTFRQTIAALRTDDPTTSVLVVSTDPQASGVWWSERVGEERIPYAFTQVEDPAELNALRSAPFAHIFIDTAGSLAKGSMVQRVLDVADDVLVPVLPEPLSFEPAENTITQGILPRGLPYWVVVNNWDPRDGQVDLVETAQFIAAKGWPLCNTVIRRYKMHTRAALNGLVCTQYQRNRIGLEARSDFQRLALELGYGGTALARLAEAVG